MTQTQLDQIVAYWQKRMRLQDWKIFVKYVRARDMSAGGRNAECYVNDQHMVAHVYLIDPADYPPNAVEPQDEEESIIHEMHHILFHAFFDTTQHAEEPWKVVACEQAINRLSSALKHGADMKAWAAAA